MCVCVCVHVISILELGNHQYLITKCSDYYIYNVFGLIILNTIGHIVQCNTFSREIKGKLQCTILMYCIVCHVTTTKLGYNFPLEAFFAMLQLHWNAAKNSRPTMYMFHNIYKLNSHNLVVIVGCYVLKLYKPMKNVQFHNHCIPFNPINSTHFSHCTTSTSEVRIRIKIQTNTTTFLD